jgi:hypothetical protein
VIFVKTLEQQDATTQDQDLMPTLDQTWHRVREEHNVGEHTQEQEHTYSGHRIFFSCMCICKCMETEGSRDVNGSNNVVSGVK